MARRPEKEDDGGMKSTAHRMPGTGVLIGAAVLIVAALGAIALLGEPRVVEYDPGTPEAIAQAYIQALFDEDYDVAFGLLAPELQLECHPDDLDAGFAQDSGTAVFEKVRRFEDRVTIEVRISTRYYEPDVFPIEAVDEHDLTTSLSLEMRNEEWRIVDTRWPLNGCARRNP